MDRNQRHNMIHGDKAGFSSIKNFSSNMVRHRFHEYISARGQVTEKDLASGEVFFDIVCNNKPVNIPALTKEWLMMSNRDFEFGFRTSLWQMRSICYIRREYLLLAQCESGSKCALPGSPPTKLEAEVADVRMWQMTGKGI